MDIRQKQGQHQKLLINLAMRQAFKVLQMPLLELGTWVDEQIDANPLLERIESSSMRDIPDPAAIPSLFRYLMEQVERGGFDEEEKKIAEEIIGNLDERGFYLGSLVGKLHVLKKVQQLDPPGIGATSLQESLLIQLEAHGKKGTALYQKILNDFENCRKELKGLSFSPGLKFSVSLLPPLVPDVIVEEKIRINDEGIPEFEISPHYAHYLEKGVEGSYLRHHLAQAKWLLRNLEKRGSTLDAITHFLMEKGERYFKGEESALPKATIQEVADRLHLHPSTISRALWGKSLLSKNGHVPFKAFFSRDEPKLLLKTLVAQEIHPQSDEELASKLGIARRTVAKYRKELGIPSSRKRSQA